MMQEFFFNILSTFTIFKYLLHDTTVNRDYRSRYLIPFSNLQLDAKYTLKTFISGNIFYRCNEKKNVWIYK